VEIEEQGRTTGLLFSAVALVSSSRLVRLPRRLYLLLREVSDFWEVAPWVASEVAFRRYPPSFLSGDDRASSAQQVRMNLPQQTTM